MDQPAVQPHPLSPYADQSFSDQSKPAKAPVVRGARACTVCRQAKMKCVGAEDGNGPCQRCKRSGSECIFEKHRRGRKPGSRLSEASKMLRRLEKGLSSAKAKSQTTDTPLPRAPAEGSSSGAYHSGEDAYSPGSSRFQNNELPPISAAPYQEGFTRPSARTDVDMDDDDDDETDRPGGGMIPLNAIRKERERNSYFRTILNPEVPEPSPPRAPPSASERSVSHASSSPVTPPAPPPTLGVAGATQLKDPVELGWLDDKDVRNLFDFFYLRLNPFINLFDPALHSTEYVRGRCKLLFTTMLMASCKFFKPELYDQLSGLAREFAVRAFAAGERSVEVVQAFACLTYWKEPTDSHVWTYIGYAARMAVDLRLNRYVGRRGPQENEREFLERRNRERTYLVLFVHDRSLSMQTGKSWMLPDCELVRNAGTWHEDGGMPMRQEDVIVAAFVRLRRDAAEQAETLRRTFHGRGDRSQDHQLSLANAELDEWERKWYREMDRAGGDTFRHSFLKLFQLYVRLFLNGIDVHAATLQLSRPNKQALLMCYHSALDELRIVAKDFAKIHMLEPMQRYGQDSITVMTAYAAVFLLRMVRGLAAELPANARDEVFTVVNKAADAYHDAANTMQACSRSVEFHANFLRTLVAIEKHQQAQQEWHKPTLPPLNLRGAGSSSSGSHSHSHSSASSQSSVFSSSLPTLQSDASHLYPSSAMQHQPPLLPPVASFSRDSGYSSAGSQPDAARVLGYAISAPGAGSVPFQPHNHAPMQASCEQEYQQWQSTSHELLSMALPMSNGTDSASPMGLLGPIMGAYGGGIPGSGGGFAENGGHGYGAAANGYGFQPVVSAYSGFAGVGR